MGRTGNNCHTPPDHPTPCAIRTHTRDAVPFLVYHRDISPDKVQVFNEFTAGEGAFGLLKGNEFIQTILK